MSRLRWWRDKCHASYTAPFACARLRSNGLVRRCQHMTEQPSMLKAALGYAARGLRVIPLYGIIDGRCTCADTAECHSPGKHPTLKNWEERATVEPAIIHGW